MTGVKGPVGAPVHDWLVHAAEHTLDSLKKSSKNLFSGFNPGSPQQDPQKCLTVARLGTAWQQHYTDQNLLMQFISHFKAPRLWQHHAPDREK